MLTVWNHHKCATELMTKVLSRLAGMNGLKYMMDHRGDFDIASMSSVADVLHIKNAHPGLISDRTTGGVHIVRNPFAIVVSAYYSHLNTHATKLQNGIWDKLALQRTRLQALNKRQGLMATIEFLLDSEFYPNTPGPLCSLSKWRFDDQNFKSLRMEDFVKAPVSQLVDAFREIGVDLSELDLPSNNEFTFEQITNDHPIGQIDEKTHSGSWNADDWRDHLEPEHVAEIRKHCHPLLERYYPELIDYSRALTSIAAQAVSPDPETAIGRVEIGDIVLNFRDVDGGGRHYMQRGHFEEYNSTIYPLLRSALDPNVCIDIGANYGYTALLMRRAFPDAILTLVEPIPWLADYIRHNFYVNAMQFDHLHSAICSVATQNNKSSFGVREKGTQDSRVILQPGMQEIETKVVTLDQLVANTSADTGLYIKIDTQGWEERVFLSGETFLKSHHRWFIKTEFAPDWLDSQGTDPALLLRWLLDRFDVFESSGRQRWNCSTLSEAIGNPLLPGCENDFVAYVRKLAMHKKGWVDLYVLPPAHRRTY
jgi:FkbM family methyltransferase